MMGKLLAGIAAVCTGTMAHAETARSDDSYTLAYASFGPPNTQLFIANGDGSNIRPLVERPSSDCNPSFSPDGQWVVFTSRRDGSADIYRVHRDGTGLERLTNHVAFDDQAVVSPDGKQIAFVSSRTGQADIWLLNLRSRQLTNLTHHPGGDYRPAWSPDGKWIAFTSDRDSESAFEHTGAQFAPLQRTQIYVVRSSGSGLRRVTEGDAAVGSAAWSPDGKSIAFYEATPQDFLYMGRTFPSPPVRAQIVSLELSTGVRNTLTSGPGRKLTPQWLGDGRIAYVWSGTEEKPGQGDRASDYWSEGIRFVDGKSGPDGLFEAIRWSRDRQSMVFQRTLEESSAPAVAPVYSPDPMFRLLRTGAFPSFSPDGRYIVYSNSGRRIAGTGRAPSRDTPASSLFIARLDGSDVRVLFNDPAHSALGAAWSPRGDLIAFGTGVSQPSPARFGAAQVDVIAPDGTGVRRVTPGDDGNYLFPSWSPDGKRLVLRAARPTSKGLFLIEVDSGAMSTLTPDLGTDNLPAWSPTADRIAFTSRRDGDWEIYTLNVDGSGLTRLTESAGNDAHAAWSPDGRWLAFSSARGGFKDEMARVASGGQGATDVFVMRSDGTDVRRLTDDAAEEGTVAFAWK